MDEDAGDWVMEGEKEGEGRMVRFGIACSGMERLGLGWGEGVGEGGEGWEDA